MAKMGRMITFEGGDGTGKTTQRKMLIEALNRYGIDVVSTREPGGSEGAEQIRRMLLTGADDRWDAITEVLLFFAARRDHFVRLIRPALDAGKWVVCDRFADSTLAYQGYGRGKIRDEIRQLTRITLGDFKPDLTLILDIDPRIGIGRTHNRDTDENRFENIPLDFHDRLREGFLTIARSEPERCVVIDAAQPEQAVHAEIMAKIAERLPLGTA
ncbi:MAG: dTMP kinase [Pseudomonadota bacterium]|nr:dTMP kinase [Pseudomonadota bacterium]